MPEETHGAILVEFMPEDVLILVKLVEQAISRNSDTRIRAAYTGILRRISGSIKGQVI